MIRRRAVVWCLSLSVLAWLMAPPPSLAERASRQGTSTVSGRVTDETGAPVPGLDVRLLTVGGYGFNASTSTNAVGNYRFSGVGPGIFKLDIVDDANAPRVLREFWKDSADTFSATAFILSEGEVAEGKDFVVTRVSHIRGQVTLGGVTTPPFLSVRAFRRVGGEWVADAADRIDPDGTYDITALRRGTYRLKFEDWTEDVPDAVATEYWPNQETIETATDISVGTAETVTRNAVLGATGTIRGRVDLLPAQPRTDLNIAVFTQRGVEWEQYVEASIDVNTDGSFVVAGLPPGDYRLRAVAQFVDEYAEEYWGDAPDVTSASSIHVLPGQTAAGVNLVLTPGASISGYVSTVPSTGSTPFVGVNAYRRDSAGGWRLVAAGGRFDGPSGSYSILGLQPGTYRLLFGNEFGRVIPEFWPDAASLAQAEDIVVENRSSVVTGKDVSVEEAATIYGDLSVAPVPLSPTAGGRVTAYRLEGGEWRPFARQPASGDYEFIDLPAGTYRIGFDDNVQNIWADAFFGGNARTLAEAEDIVVAPGEIAADRDISFQPGVSSVRAPEVRGTPRVGAVLRADPGDWTPEETSLRIQWLANGVPISGATGPTFKPTSRQLGQTLSIRVGGSLASFVGDTAVSAATARVAIGTVSHRTRPRLEGKTRVGEVLRVVGGGWSPSSARLTYVWLADRRKIRHATKPQLTLRPQQRGKRITVRIRAVAPNYRPDVVTTRPTARVR